VDSVKGFHVEPTNICTLKCPGCSRTQFIEDWPGRWKNHSLSIDALDRFLDIDLSGKKITLCGNYGDPIYHPDLIGLVALLKIRGADIDIITNGSYRDRDWWHDLVSVMTQQDRIMFSIDGVPENFTQYRINADWRSIAVGIEVVVRSPVRTVWKFIPFAFNQDQIEIARELGQQLGIDDFLVTPSNRFDRPDTMIFRPDPARAYPDFVSSQLPYRIDHKQGKPSKVDPKCSDQMQHYISADGHYTPCCFIAEHRFYYASMFGKNKNCFNIVDQTLTQILSQPKTIEFYRSITSESPKVCQFSCPLVG
jgi:MoaA/NifB/PqqE/SkfB family radical SAM enzyme